MRPLLALCLSIRRSLNLRITVCPQQFLIFKFTKTNLVLVCQEIVDGHVGNPTEWSLMTMAYPKQKSYQLILILMKDFQAVIEHGQLPPAPVKEGAKPNKFIEWRDKLLPYAAPFLLSLVTGPFTTVSVLLQVTPKANPTAGLQAKIKAQPLLERHILNGIFGDNRIYEAPSLNGYRDALGKLGRQGIRGIYKGNLTGLLLASSNAWLRGNLYTTANEQKWMGEGMLSTNLITVATCTLADLITLPLMTAQSRLILQNSSPHFRTYKSFLSVFAKAKLPLLFSGASLLLFKNLMFDLAWVKLLPEAPAYSFMLSTLLSHLLTYPFVTILRQMQVSDRSGAMMFPRDEKVRQCVKRIWAAGPTTFYRGFLGYSVVHLFMGALMVQTNLRSGYFEE